jgi:hypothetical protein
LEHFEKLKKGPPYDKNFNCKNKSECVESGGGGCLKKNGVEIGWSYEGDKIYFNMQPSEKIKF